MTDIQPLAVDPPQVEEAVAQIDGQIKDAEEKRRDLDGQYRAARDQIDTHLANLRDARRTLLRKRTPKKKRARTGPLDPAAQAGAKNIAKVLEAAKKHPLATQAELSHESGVGTGSMTHAIKALEARGEVEFTGTRIDGSKQFRFIGKRSRVRKPGAGAK